MLEQISSPPAATSSNPIYTPATVGDVGCVPDPVHEIGPHVIALVVRVELFYVREAEAFPLTHVNKSRFVVTKHCCKIDFIGWCLRRYQFHLRRLNLAP